MANSPFASLGIPASGMHVYKTWVDSVADNIANVNTIRPTNEAAFQARYVVAQAVEYGNNGIGSGVQIAGAAWGPAEGRLQYQPDHPLADAQGYVRAPDFELSDQMTSLMVAQRAYQMNVAVFERARDSIQRALEIGK